MRWAWWCSALVLWPRLWLTGAVVVGCLLGMPGSKPSATCTRSLRSQALISWGQVHRCVHALRRLRLWPWLWLCGSVWLWLWLCGCGCVCLCVSVCYCVVVTVCLSLVAVAVAVAVAVPLTAHVSPTV